MTLPKLIYRLSTVLLLTVCYNFLQAQVQIKGIVYDRSQLYPLPGVSVIGVSGIGTVTDSLGRYNIKLPSGDSIYFSYLGKATSKFAVNDIPFNLQFDMSIDVSIDSLPSVSVISGNYRLDSLANRREYQKIFDYGGIKTIENMKATRRVGVGLGFDLDAFFSGANERRTEAFQKRLEDEEQQKYVDHRFTRALVKRVTGLEPPALDSFMVFYRPSYNFLKTFETDWEFYKYILDSSKIFAEAWKENHPDK
ncbi:MAG TPA: carboxypeptidase-like regulatory domain-containing protein [Puia sp.]|nr:carboxypeptidase-like regulatory domain-containing protein [Puia sp.]